MTVHTEFEKLSELFNKAEEYFLNEIPNTTQKFIKACRTTALQITKFGELAKTIPEPNPQLQAIIAWRKKYLN